MSGFFEANLSPLAPADRATARAIYDRALTYADGREDERRDRGYPPAGDRVQFASDRFLSACRDLAIGRRPTFDSPTLAREWNTHVAVERAVAARVRQN